MRSKPQILILLVFLLTASVFGQMAQKPAGTLTDETNEKTTGSKRFLPSIQSQADFDLMARVYNAKTPYALPHVMFVIDRSDKDKIYYVNSQMFRFHQDFANAQ